MAIDHDQIFKRLIEAFFREFMELFCPAEATLIDFSRVEFLREEYFTDVKRGRRKRLDLVVKVGLKAGGEKFVLVHVEFEASRKEKDFPGRMFKYFCQLFLRYETDIIPIAVFTDDARWRNPVPDFFEVSLPTKMVVRFEYHLIKLRNLDYRRFLESNNPLTYALMAKMSYNRKERVRLKADFLRLILGAGIDPARRSLLVEFVETYMPLNRSEQVDFKQVVRSDRKYEKVVKMITTYEKEGLKQGIEQGIGQGRAEAKQEDLILLMEKKFGKLKAGTKQKIRRIESVKKLESLLVSVLDAGSIDELEF